MTAAKFEDILSRIDSGPWTWMVFVLTSVWGLFGAMQAVSAVFLSPPSLHWCAAPFDLLNSSSTPPWTTEQIKNISIPWDAEKKEYSSCEMYNRSYSELAQMSYDEALRYTDLANHTTTPCTEWDYDRSVFSSTIVTEWDLVCGRDYLRSFVQSTFMAGVFVSSPINGMLADRFGRKRVLSVALVVFLAACVMAAVVIWFPMFLAARFVIALAGHCVYQTSYIIAVETCSIRHRSTVGILFSVPFALGYMLLPGIAYLVRDWRYLHCAISFPVFLLIFNTILLPESPRWLIQKGRTAAAVLELQRAARWNRQQPLDHAWLTDTIAAIQLGQKDESSSSSSTEPTKSSGKDDDTPSPSVFSMFLELFRTAVMCRVTVVLSVVWLTCTLVYYGISMNSANLSADPYLYMVLGGLVELPCYILGGPIVRMVGRRATIIVSLLVTGAAILGPLAVDQEEEMSWWLLSIIMVGKCAVTLAFQVLFLYTSELYPTCIRTQGLGFTSMVGRVGGILSPFITDRLGSVWWAFPSLIFGGCSVITGLLTCLLPETMSQHLPDTLHQMQRSENDGQAEVAAASGTENGQLLANHEEDISVNHIDLQPITSQQQKQCNKSILT